MLTLFTIPKPFRGHIGIIQRNAIQSWLKLKPECEIILCGNEEGLSEIAAECGIRHMPDVQKNEYGTPLLSSVFEQAQNMAKNTMVCYVNADIILMSDFIAAIQRIHTMKQVLMVGQRYKLDIKESIDFENDWEVKIKNYVLNHGIVGSTYCIDYFVFSRGMLKSFPKFAVGRPGWDNWLIYHARMRHIPVIDASKVVTAIHQNHDYTHVPKSRGDSWEGPEADNNRRLIGCSDRLFEIMDASHILMPESLIKAKNIKRRLRRIPVYFPRTKPVFDLVNYATYIKNYLLSKVK